MFSFSSLMYLPVWYHPDKIGMEVVVGWLKCEGHQCLEYTEYLQVLSTHSDWLMCVTHHSITTHIKTQTLMESCRTGCNLSPHHASTLHTFYDEDHHGFMWGFSRYDVCHALQNLMLPCVFNGTAIPKHSISEDVCHSWISMNDFWVR